MAIDYGSPELIMWQVSKRLSTVRYKATLVGKPHPEVQAALADAEAAYERALHIQQQFVTGRLSREEARQALFKEHRIAYSAAWDRIDPLIPPDAVQL